MSIQQQLNIRNNTQDVRNYIGDLYEWEESMKKKKKQKKNINQNLPIRGNVHEQEKKQKEAQIFTEDDIKKNDNKEQAQTKQYKRDSNTVQDYYKAWDKFNVEDELERLEEKKQDTKPEEMFKDPKNKPRSQKILIKGGNSNQLSEINSLKEKANIFFSNGNFNSAIDLYQECVQKLELFDTQNFEYQMKAVLLSNKAQCNLNLLNYSECIKDCNESIQSDKSLTKTYFRRGVAYKKIGNLKLSLIDLKTAQQMDQNNPNVNKEIELVLRILNKRKEDYKNKMIVNQRFSQFESQIILIRDSDEIQKIQLQKNKNEEINQNQQNKQFNNPGDIKKYTENAYQDQTVKQEQQIQNKINQQQELNQEITKTKLIEENKQEKQQNENKIQKQKESQQVKILEIAKQETQQVKETNQQINKQEEVKQIDQKQDEKKKQNKTVNEGSNKSKNQQKSTEQKQNQDFDFDQLIKKIDSDKNNLNETDANQANQEISKKKKKKKNKQKEDKSLEISQKKQQASLNRRVSFSQKIVDYEKNKNQPDLFQKPTKSILKRHNSDIAIVNKSKTEIKKVIIQEIPPQNENSIQENDKNDIINIQIQNDKNSQSIIEKLNSISQNEIQKIDISKIQLQNSSDFKKNFSLFKNDQKAQLQFLINHNQLNFKQIFQQDLDPDLFAQIIKIFKCHYDQCLDTIIKYFLGFLDVIRFEICLKCLTRKEKDDCKFLVQQTNNNLLMEKYSKFI